MKLLQSRSHVIWAVVLFFAALLPRLYALGTFLTIDEVKWAEGAAQFLIALNNGQLAATYWHFHPGITITWGDSVAFWALCQSALDFPACVTAQAENLPQSIGWLRLPVVVIVALSISGIYLAGRKLFGNPVALLAAFLLAFDPFFIAHSRIINGDVLSAALMNISLLTFLFYWFSTSQNNRLRLSNAEHTKKFLNPWLFVSAIMAGLALLTKLPAPLIGVYVGALHLLAAITEWRTRGGAKALLHWGLVLALWGGIALATFVLLWPALWVAPVTTLHQMYVDSFQVGGVGEGHAAFYLGKTVFDPGSWFYPYAIAFRLTPVVLFGFLAGLVWLTTCLVKREATEKNGQLVQLISGLVLLVFIIFVILFSNISPKKLDRYVMSVIPPIIWISSLGIVQATRWVVSRIHLQNPTRYATGIIAAVILLQLSFSIFAAPYYLTYYNPLLGGVDKAAAQVPVGWGEGMEKAATYLNKLPNAKQLTVSSWYGDMFHPYFVGQEASFSDDGRAQLSADYVVFYVNQIQRQKPYPGLIDYFRKNDPAFTVSSNGLTQGNGVNWVEIYPAPAAQNASGAPKVEGVAQLLAYTIAGNRLANNVPVKKTTPPLPDNQLAVTLYLRTLGPLPQDTTIAVSLENNGAWGKWTHTEMIGIWQQGNVIEWHGTLDVPVDTPAGEYKLWVSFQFTDGTVIAPFPIADKDPPIILE